MKALRAEWIGLMTTRAPIGHLAAILFFSLLPLLLIPLVASQEAGMPGVPDLADPAGQLQLLETASITLVVGAVLGAVVASRRHRHRTIIAQLLVTPRRHVAAGAQFAVLAAAGLVLGAIGALVTIGTSWLGLQIAGEALAVGGGALVRLVIGGMAAGVVGVALGTAVGEATRSSGPAIAIVVVLLFLVDGLVVGLLPDIGRWLPSALLSRVQLGSASPVPGAVGDVTAGVGLAAVVAVSALVATVLPARRDAV